MSDLPPPPDEKASVAELIQRNADDLKAHATRAGETARASFEAIAADARGRVTRVVDARREDGAAQLSGLAKAAQTAAGDLEAQSPAAARLVRDAAGSVDRIAGTLRSSDVRDVVSSVSTFARSQPFAFVAGSVMLGYAIAQFLKKEPQPAVETEETAGTIDTIG